MSAVQRFIRYPLAVTVTLSAAWCAVTTAWCGIAGDPTGKLDADQNDVKTISVDSNGHIQHSKPREKRNGDTDIPWTVVWTAPDANDELIVSVAAVAANDVASALGDYVYTATARVNSSGLIL